MRQRVEDHPSTFGRVVDAFALGGRLYATIKLNEGVRVPPQIAEWMETSLSDICWPASDGHGKPEIIELSGTGSAARPGCRVLGQTNPRAFRSEMAQKSVLERMDEGQKAAVQKLMKLLDSHPDALEFAKLVPPELRDAIGPEFAGIVSGLEKARAIEKQPAAAAAAPAAAADQQDLEKFARDMAARELSGYGVPKEMAAGYLAKSKPSEIPTVVSDISAMLTACSKHTMERLGHRSPADDAGEPARQQPCQSADWRESSDERQRLSDQNLARLKGFRGY
jgi:hypothetical protein